MLENIEEVSIDLWSGYKSVAEELMPNAEIVADRFHVMKKINEELDGQRKKERREMALHHCGMIYNMTKNFI